MLDPRTHAVRADLADVRLADQVFAPHYAAGSPHRVTQATPLRASRGADAETLAILQPGDLFELLDRTGDHGWGIAAATGLVGYCDATALTPA